MCYYRSVKPKRIESIQYPTTIKKYIKKTLEENIYLFEKYPGHRFNFTGALRYSMMKEYYPEQFEKINEEQFPPNPNEFDSTCCIFLCKTSVSGIKEVSLIGVLKFKLGKIISFCNKSVTQLKITEGNK